VAGTSPLRFFEYGENQLQDLTWNLSDWDRALLDGEIQRTLNRTDTYPVSWTAPNSGTVHAELQAGSIHTERRQMQVRRLHILNQTPGEITPVSGDWRSWGGALLRAAPTADPSKIIGRLAPTTKTQILGKVLGIDSQSWLLVGYRGFGVGYVKQSDLRPLDSRTRVSEGARPSFRKPVNLDFAPTLRDPVYASVSCRSLTVNGHSMNACKGLDGRWRAS